MLRYNSQGQGGLVSCRYGTTDQSQHFEASKAHAYIYIVILAKQQHKK